ncbi:hypothetical protein VTN49DRAFT_6463 [Thermomyces lanuginosus]|uniref:uncharacterized protein n=1 Tax=Thermomyces lanuginosus TaxID=5541 RepID=UPI003744911D
MVTCKPSHSRAFDTLSYQAETPRPPLSPSASNLGRRGRYAGWWFLVIGACLRHKRVVLGCTSFLQFPKQFCVCNV